MRGHGNRGNKGRCYGIFVRGSGGVSHDGVDTVYLYFVYLLPPRVDSTLNGMMEFRIHLEGIITTYSKRESIKRSWISGRVEMISLLPHVTFLVV